MKSDQSSPGLRISDAGGEQAVIDWFRENTGGFGPQVELGIGDDCAVLPGASSRLVTTDILVEGTHFRTDLSTLYEIGWKSVAVNLSDIAAMGGVPAFTFLSVALPDMLVADAYRLFEGIRDCCRTAGCAIAGGDTVFSASGIVVSVTQTGFVPEGAYISRSGARAGDVVFVSGTLGDSAAGLRILLAQGQERAREYHPFLADKHLRPTAALVLSAKLAKTGCVSAMIDISDGLCKDLRRLCGASGVGAAVDIDKLPLSDELKVAAAQLNMDAAQIAAAGGEDFELLFTCPADKTSLIIEAANKAGTPVTPIGKITPAPDVLLQRGNINVPWPNPWEHFISR